MKITVVQGAFLPVPPLMGGAIEKVWYGLGREFARRGHDVVHLSRRHPDLPEEETIEGVRHRRIPGFDTPSNLFVLKLYDLIYTLRAIRHLPESDVLVSNTFWLPTLLRTESKGRLYVHVARVPKGQMILYAHAARLQTISTAVGRAVRSQLPGSTGEKVRTIPLPLPEEVPVRKRAPVYRERTREILYVGRVHPEKGLELLVEAYGRFVRRSGRGWRLVIVGPWQSEMGGGGASYRERLDRLRRETPGTVSFEGPVFEDDALYAYHRRARLFVYPSLAERGETFGLAPLEAMACGCPPVVSDLACFRDYLSEGENGFSFDHRGEAPVEALTETIERALSSPVAWRELSRSCRRTAEEYEISRVADRYLEDFRRLLRASRVSAQTPA